MTSEEADFDSEPTPEEQSRINQLSSAQVAEIDAALVANCVQQWRKVARVVGTTMLDFKGKFAGLPDVYYSKRVAHLAASGKLEVQGNIRRMRFSEVRLPVR